MEIRLDALEPDHFYHIYNRGINGTQIFESEDNYLFFLRKFNFFLLPVCEIYSYCLMPNHFHFVIRIKSDKEIRLFTIDNDQKSGAFAEKGLHSYDSIISKQFAKFISSYSQAYNKFNKKRTGALLESPFKRIRITDEQYLRRLIVYIHQNPKKLISKLEDYPFSSYRSLISNEETFLKSNEVIKVFDDIGNFIFCHQKEEDLL